jgi:hypothetical protein
VHPQGPSYSADVAAASWIGPRLRDETGTVGSVVPTGYPAYARLLHPVDSGGDTLVRWWDVAARTGRTVHPLVQWHRLVGSGDPLNRRRGEVDDGPPGEGELPQADLHTLLGVLTAHTATPDDCWSCVWEGWAWVAKRPGSVALSSFSESGPVPDPEHGPPGFTAEQLAGPRVVLPGRSYLLLHGPLDAVRFVGDQVTPDWFLPQSPTLWWPADRAWFVGTEVDFDSTLVAGSRALVDELLAHPGLEAFEVDPDDSLTWDADQVN